MRRLRLGARRSAVDLVEHQQARHVAGADLRQHLGRHLSCRSKFGSDASTTWASSPASSASSSVLLNEATRPCGSLSMKPTVSDSSTRGRVAGTQRPHGRVQRREQLVGDVAPRCRSARASASTCRRWCSRPARPRLMSLRAGALRALLLGQRASSRVSSAMRSRILRRSSSSADSPAPLPPMPPRCRSLPLGLPRAGAGPGTAAATISTWALAARERRGGGRSPG